MLWRTTPSMSAPSAAAVRSISSHAGNSPRAMPSWMSPTATPWISRRRRSSISRIAGEDQLVLALEVGVDRPDGQAARADDVLHRRPVEAALREDAGRRADDPLTDFLLVLGADSRHRPLRENEWLLSFHGSPWLA